MNLAVPALMSQAEFAAHRGVKAPAVSGWKKKGLLVFAESEDGKLLVDVARSVARLNAKLDPTRGRPRSEKPTAVQPLPSPRGAGDEGAGGEVDIGSDRRELVREQVTRERMRNAEKAGELVPLIEFERRAAELGRQMRERVQAALAVVAEKVANEIDPRKVRALLQDEIDRVFGALADAVVAGALAEVAAAVEEREDGPEGEEAAGPVDA